jgi:DNA polymerase III delta prime subunit
MTDQQQTSDVLKSIVTEGLHKTRLNLLDLSGRNRLLNFKHTGSKILRIVDELPNQIFSELLSNADSEQKSGFILSPVPLPKKTEYPDIDDIKKLQSIDVKSHAKKLNISTEWEMQATAQSSEAKHQDDKLQTLHYPEDLDRLVRRIQSEAKTAIEESGVNMLFLCLGFLKWSDSKNSDIFSHSPLIMIPIEIERDKKVNTKTGFANFRVKYTGEDILDNICLREKLKQFAIELPSFEEFETPEDYFSALTEVLKDIKPEWAIQRFITAGFLSFGKMLMYLDLAAERWPEIDGIADSPHIIDIFSGGHSGDNNVADEFDIDGDKKLPKVPHVMDADSSQHSAIIDVLNGKNLVIEGPPGTGKSQTITNLIAACMAEGKSVLFVAEKLAALQVVRKRLDSVGLGNFCLELHSHKTQKKSMMADLKKRLDMNTKGYRSATATAEDRLAELNQIKRKLIDYSIAINTPFGDTGETPHEIFWKTDILKKGLSQEYKPELFATPKNVTKLTHATIRNQIATIKNLADKLRDYFGGDQRVADHFWHGINLPGPVDYALQQDIFQGLKTLGQTARAAQDVFTELDARGFQEDAFVNYREVSTDMGAFSEDDFANVHLFDSIYADNLPEILSQTIRRLQDLASQTEAYSKLLFFYNIEDEQVGRLNERLIINEVKLPNDRSFQELQENLEKIDHAVKKFEATVPLFKEAVEYINLNDEKFSLAVLRSVKRVAETCSGVDKAILLNRSSVIENALGNPALDDLINKVITLRSERETLDQYFDLDHLPTIVRLKEIYQELKDKNLFSVLSSNWRTALSDLRKFSKNKQEKDYKLAASKVDALIGNQSATDTLTKNATFISLLPDLFQGINTDIDSLKKGISFYEILREGTLSYPTYGTKLYTTLKNQDRVIFEWFVQHKESLCGGLQALDDVNSMLSEKGENNNSFADISVVLEKIKNSVAEFHRVKSVIDDLKIPATSNIQQLKDLSAARLTLKAANDDFVSDTIVRKLNLSASAEFLPTHLTTLNQLNSLAIQVEKLLPAGALSYALCSDGFNNIQSLKAHADCICAYLEAQKALRQHIPDLLILKDFWQTSKFDERLLLSAIARKLSDLESESTSFDKWCDIVNSFSETKAAGLDETINSFAKSVDPTVPFSDYVPLYFYLVYNALSNEALRKSNVLGSFARISHENIRNSFKEIDIELQKLNSQILAHEISRKTIPEGSSAKSTKDYTGAYLIRHEIGKQKSHLPIRKLVAQAYDSLVAMKPCFMMGPLSVAQYLAPGHKKFDVLIMDEASQVKPEDAIGILARAKQVVVVGDSNQLPPTGFFDTLGDGGDSGDDDATTIQDSESILDVCKPIFQPIRRLRWHYRSQHQSLISFSNHHFYDNDLVIFPSPTAHSETVGVKHVYVPDGIYSNQSNLIEAQRLVQDIVHMIGRYPDRSYGIVTLNAKQKMLIEDEIERVRKENPIFDKFISETENSDEDLFVKNLENVQGDERDVIYISTTFGPDENGAFRQNFGPINGKNGWRRLNVLFTRAKQHIRIFSSFHGERIKVDDSKEQRGLRALKDYLHFAATGVDNHSYLTENEPDSDFERAVGSFLRNKGYDVVYQLGVAGYKIDMVVKHPQNNSDYVAAIECDGATYHSAKSARDRDRLREDNLRKLGWNHIHRIWSTDWFKRREQEEDRLLKAIDIAIQDYDDRFSNSENIILLDAVRS